MNQSSFGRVEQYILAFRQTASWWNGRKRHLHLMCLKADGWRAPAPSGTALFGCDSNTLFCGALPTSYGLYQAGWFSEANWLTNQVYNDAGSWDV